MSDTYFPVRYSQLNTDALQDELMKRYDLKRPFSCQVFDYGLNDIYIVKEAEINYFLRVSMTGVHERRDYEEEIYIINTLCEKGIRAAAPIRCRDGSFVWKVNAPEGLRYAVLFTEAKKVPSDDNVKKMHNLGHMLAQIHGIADEKNFMVSRPPIDLSQLVKRPLEMILPYLEHRPSDYEFLKNTSDRLSKYVTENLSYEKPFYGYCHGDIHSGNVHFEGDEPNVFDFDCMGYGWRAYDICIYAWNETGSDKDYIEKEPWHSFLEGYNSVRRLSEAELASINAFAALRELWLMGLHADIMNRNCGCSWYNDGYFDYRICNLKLWYERLFPTSTLTPTDK